MSNRQNQTSWNDGINRLRYRITAPIIVGQLRELLASLDQHKLAIEDGYRMGIERVIDDGNAKAIWRLWHNDPIVASLKRDLTNHKKQRAEHSLHQARKAGGDAIIHEADAQFGHRDNKIYAPVTTLLPSDDPEILVELLRDKITPPSIVDAVAEGIGSVMTGNPLGYVRIIKGSFDSSRKYRHRRELKKTILALHICRPAGAFTEQQKGLYKTAARLRAAGTKDQAWWEEVQARLGFGSGDCKLDPIGTYYPSQLGRARELVRGTLIQQTFDQNAYIHELAADIGGAADNGLAGTQDITEHLNEGDRFFTEGDIDASDFVRVADHPNALSLGPISGTNTDIGYLSATSTVVLGRAGSGKTQCMLLRNCIDYAGPMLLFDPKRELYEWSHKARERFGPVIRFAPCELGNNASFNIFQFISHLPELAPGQLDILIKNLIPDGNENEPIWSQSARSVLWGLAFMVALTHSGRDRSIPGLCRLVSKLAEVEDLMQLTFDMERLATQSAYGHIPALEAAAKNIRGLADSPRTFMGVRNNITANLDIFQNNPIMANALAGDADGKSSWSPLDFRKKNITVYLNLSPSEMRTYAPILKAMMELHLDMWLRDASRNPPARDQLPTQIVADEFHQLGYFEPWLRIADIARGAKIRTLLATQNMGQIRDSYGERANSLVSNVEAAVFLKPGLDEFEILEKCIGDKRNLFNGESEKLEFMHHLMGAKYKDKAICICPGGHNIILDKRFAYKTHSQWAPKQS